MRSLGATHVWRTPRRCTSAAAATQMALAEAEIAEGRHAEWPMVLAALAAPRRPRPHRRGRAVGRCGPTRTCRPARRSTWPRRSPRSSSASRPVSATWWSAVRSVPASRLADHNANLVGGDIGVGGNNMFSALDRAHAAAQPLVDADPEGLPVLVGRPARRRRARHGRLLRRAHGAAPRVRHQEAPTLSPYSWCRDWLEP